MDDRLWQVNRVRLEAVVAEVRARASAAGLDVVVEVEPAEEPGAGVGWNWHLEFRAGDLDVGVFAAPELTAFLIEDGDGRFEVEATPAGFPQALVDRLAGAG